MAKRSYVGGFLRMIFGMAMGAAIVGLFSPNSGEENRKRLRSKADELVEDGREIVSSQKERVLELVDKGREKTSKTIDELKDKIEDAKKTVDEKS